MVLPLGILRCYREKANAAALLPSKAWRRHAQRTRLCLRQGTYLLIGAHFDSTSARLLLRVAIHLCRVKNGHRCTYSTRTEGSMFNVDSVVILHDFPNPKAFTCTACTPALHGFGVVVPQLREQLASTIADAQGMQARAKLDVSRLELEVEELRCTNSQTSVNR